ncbi:MAG TPA: hypothetical protein VND22_01315 [Actinomycetota bacterium]|nr:hypothetical protein [Actinomycetota bacterium]
MRRLAFLVLALAFVLVACGEGRDLREVVTGTGDITAPRIKVPGQILGLAVQPEDIANQVKSVDRPYVDSVGMFSLREEDLLRATYQVARFNGLARPEEKKFRDEIIGLVGSSDPQEIRVNDTIVYSTAGNQQQVYLWFKGNGYFVLSVHQDFEFPRTLLRRVVSLPITL